MGKRTHTKHLLVVRRDHLCIWDTLLPPSSSMVCCKWSTCLFRDFPLFYCRYCWCWFSLCDVALPGHDSGAYAVAYEGQGHFLFSGGKRGEIVVSDIRQRSTMHTFTAHSSRIRSIAIDAQNHTLITGSIDGELKVKERIRVCMWKIANGCFFFFVFLKIWDASTYKQIQTFDIQPRNRFLAPSFNRIPVSDHTHTHTHCLQELICMLFCIAQGLWCDADSISR